MVSRADCVEKPLTAEVNRKAAVLIDAEMEIKL